MSVKCLRCSTPLLGDYQLIFDETGIELRLDKLLEEYFEIVIEEDPSIIQALCEECVNELTTLFDISQMKREIPAENEQPPGDEVFDDQDFIVEELNEEDIAMSEQGGSIDDDYFSEFDTNIHEDTIVNMQQNTEDLEDINTQVYIREVVKSELQEITFEQNTTCRFCEEVLKSHTAVLMHASSNHENEDKSYPCVICDKDDGFKTINDLAFHVVLKHYDLEAMTIYCTCPECGKRFSNFIQYNKHSCYKKTVGNRLLQECIVCLKEFASNKRYRFHLQFHLEKRRPKACFICDILFSDENDLFEHIMYAHEKEDSLICKKCDRICTSRESYKNHVKLHNAVRSFKCKHCSKSYLYKQMLDNHVQRHHTQKEHNTCDKCGKSLTNKHLLSRHMQLKHGEDVEADMFVCSNCGFLGKSEESVLEHIENENCTNASVVKEHIKIAYACEYCEAAFNSVENLKVHWKRHSNNMFMCWICSSEYSEYKKLKTHIMTHNMFGPIQKTYPVSRHYVCDYKNCNKSYSTWPTLRAHKTRHKADSKFTCQVCDQTFRSQSLLNAHTKAHENNEEYPCHFCSKMCTTQMALAVHIARKHNNNCMTCPHCKNTYTSQEALKEHIDLNHVKITCEHCGKETKNKRNLQIHIRMVHTKMKRFFCSQCEKGYYNRGDLKVHETTTHSGSVYKCDHCDFATGYVGSFEAHKLKHASKKPFKCEDCGKEFTRKTCFKLHCLRHSNNKPFACPVEDCGKQFVTQGVLNTHIRDSHQKPVGKVGRPAKRKHVTEEKSEEYEDDSEVLMEIDSNSVPLRIAEAQDGTVVIYDETTGDQGNTKKCNYNIDDVISNLIEVEFVYQE